MLVRNVGHLMTTRTRCSTADGEKIPETFLDAHGHLAVRRCTT